MLNDGTLVTFGSNLYGQLGTKHPKSEGFTFDTHSSTAMQNNYDQDQDSPADNDYTNEQLEDTLMPMGLKRRLKELKKQQESELPQHIAVI